MSSDFCQPCYERLIMGRKRGRSEWCRTPSCANYEEDLRRRVRRGPKLKGLKGIVGS